MAPAPLIRSARNPAVSICPFAPAKQRAPARRPHLRRGAQARGRGLTCGRRRLGPVRRGPDSGRRGRRRRRRGARRSGAPLHRRRVQGRCRYGHAAGGPRRDYHAGPAVAPRPRSAPGPGRRARPGQRRRHGPQRRRRRRHRRDLRPRHGRRLQPQGHARGRRRSVSRAHPQAGGAGGPAVVRRRCRSLRSQRRRRPQSITTSIGRVPAA